MCELQTAQLMSISTVFQRALRRCTSVRCCAVLCLDCTQQHKPMLCCAVLHVCVSSGCNDAATAEVALMLMLMLMRRVDEAR